MVVGGFRSFHVLVTTLRETLRQIAQKRCTAQI